jgi:hypothetical protein
VLDRVVARPWSFQRRRVRRQVARGRLSPAAGLRSFQSSYLSFDADPYSRRTIAFMIHLDVENCALICGSCLASSALLHSLGAGTNDL